jgi:hypothetical protein
MTHRRFHVARASTPIDARSAAGTAFLFDLSSASSVRIAIDRLANGTRSRHRCLAHGRVPRHTLARRCKRTVPVATLRRRSEPAGYERIAFTGRIGRSALRSGSYEARLTATNASGSSAPVAVRFDVVRR